jgi:hypothetical protein
MKLYYTTPTAQDQIQTDPRLSLGGYKSASPVPNDAFDNLFTEISQFMLSKGNAETEYIGLILKNETAYNIQGLRFWFDYQADPYSQLQVAAVNLTSDTNGVLKMEHVPTRNSKPLYADFYPANGVDNAVEIGDLEVGEMMGLWFCRSLVDNLAATVQADSKLYETDPSNTNLVRPIVPVNFDSMTIHFDWTNYGEAIGEELITDYFVTQDLATLYTGDTYLGADFSLTTEEDPDQPLDLSEALIELVTGTAYKLSTLDDTIRITDAPGGLFIIPEQIISWPPATYNFKIKITFASGRVRTYVVGTWKILR